MEAVLETTTGTGLFEVQVAPSSSPILDATIRKLEKRYGTGCAMRLNAGVIEPVEVIPTGSLALDIALGVGGVPRGRITEVFGPESSGKTTLALQVIAQAHAAGLEAVFVDMEHALDFCYARACGVDVGRLIVSQPDTGEQALEIMEAFIRSGAAGVVVLDSVAALVPQAEVEGDMGDSSAGRQSRLMSQAMRKLAGAIHQSKTAVVLTNQLRHRPGVLFGNSETTTGGVALKFYAAVRLDLRTVQYLKASGKVYGSRIRARIVKSKVAPPFRAAEFEIIFGQGIDRIADILDLGVEARVIEKRNGLYVYDGNEIGRGCRHVKETLRRNTLLATEIERMIRESLAV